MTRGEEGLTQELARIGAREGETDLRVSTLLWLARLYYGQDDLDSYAGVFPVPETIDAEEELRVDGVVNHVVGTDLQHVLFVWIGPDERKQAIRRALILSDLVLSDANMVERALRHSPVAGPLIAEMRPLRRSTESAAWQVAVVSDQVWSAAEKKALADGGHKTIDIWDSRRLNDLTDALLAPGWLEETVSVDALESERLNTTAGARRLFVAPVNAIQIASWPGIDSRRLFDLNVRFGLGSRNRVRQSLDQAFLTQDPSDFIASHNGLTVVCERVDEHPDRLVVTNLSVVNGAQSVIALYENSEKLGPDLRLLVKFVEVGRDDMLASEIAVRSNTQNPVTGRNLRALDESQVRLKAELGRRHYFFDTRPDTGRTVSEKTIKNDDAAQWICTVYLERPWLAVKRTSLFATDVFQEIFPPTIGAEQVILLQSMRHVVNAAKDEFPAELQRTWLLTALTAMYLIGQLMRFDEGDRRLLLSPDAGAGDSENTMRRLRELVEDVVRYLTARHERLASSEGYDNFRVDFKRQRTLLEMASEIVLLARSRARGDEE